MRKNMVICFELLLTALVAIPLGVGRASVEKHTVSKSNYQMSYPIVYVDHNEAAQNRINSDLYQYIAGFQNSYETGDFSKGDFSYLVRYEDDKLISLTLADYRYRQDAVHGYTYTRGLTYSKVTGEKLLLPYFVKISTADKGLILSQPIYNSQNERIPLNQTFAQDAFMWNKLKISDNYYLAGGGNIVLLYPPYELGSYAQGTLRVVLSPRIIDYLNRKN